MEKKLHYDDVTIVPEVITTIKSRSECDPYIDDMLPIFAAPMDTVIDAENWKIFYKNKINVVIPRNINLEDRLDIMMDCCTNDSSHMKPFIAFSLKEASDVFLNREQNGKRLKRLLNNTTKVFRICIDMANGHMKDLLDVIKRIKDFYNDRVVVMAGNIANPLTYKEYENAGCDYVRCCIGSGSACTTASNVGIYYPAFSLIKDIYEIKRQNNYKCKIVADGGIRGYRDIQKALIYADYVMIGGLFNKTIESSGKTTYGEFYKIVRGRKIKDYIKTFLNYGKEVKKEDYDIVIDKVKSGEVVVLKEFYGMSTKKAQLSINNGNNSQSTKLKTSEGLVKKNIVEFNISGWAENETDYLKSAMSYTNSRNLDEYKNSEWVEINRISYNN